MNKVTTINLNGKAYQVEEAGYVKLKSYLDEASEKLANNPDKQEILADFEQAIAEKADSRLNFRKTVITEPEVDEMIREMGPVDGEEGVKSEKTEQKKAAPPSSLPKRFYRIREGKILGGVCTGLAAYFNVDVVLIRIIVILLTLATHGVMVAAYIIALLIVPMADTDEKLAAAYGVPFTAQELMDRAKTEYGSAKQSFRAWRKDRRHRWREAVHQERMEMMREAHRHDHSPLHILLRVVLGVIAAVLTIGWIIGLITLFMTGALFGSIWIAIPIWLTAILFTIVYGIIVAPFSEGKHWNHDGGYGYRCHHGGGGFGILVLIFVIWAVYQFIPESHPVFLQVGDAARHAWINIKQAFGG